VPFVFYFSTTFSLIDSGLAVDISNNDPYDAGLDRSVGLFLDTLAVGAQLSAAQFDTEGLGHNGGNVSGPPPRSTSERRCAGSGSTCKNSSQLVAFCREY
jgi:hypothetical protein